MDDTVAAALQDVLAAEHASVFGLGIVGGLLPAGDQRAMTSFQAHQSQRDVLIEALSAAGRSPEPAAAAYVPQRRVDDATDARALATDIERDSAVAYLALVVAGDQRWRRTGSQWLRECAVREYRWSGRLPLLPGQR